MKFFLQNEKSLNKTKIFEQNEKSLIKMKNL